MRNKLIADAFIPGGAESAAAPAGGGIARDELRERALRVARPLPARGRRVANGHVTRLGPRTLNRADVSSTNTFATENSRLELFAQILGVVLEIAVRDLLGGGGRHGGQRRGSAEGPLADGARRGMGTRLAELRGETIPDEVRRLANERSSSRNLETWHPASFLRDPPNERAVARDARAQGGRSPRNPGLARGAAAATPRGGKTPARAAAFTRARQSTMGFVRVRIETST